MPVSSDPRHLAVSKSKGLKIDWQDGHYSEYSCEYLRDECPCATCTGAHGNEPQRSHYGAPAAPSSDPFPIFKPRIAMDAIEEVGAYAVRMKWNDGHSAGIYSFDYLRSICPCPVCVKAREEV